MDAKKFLEEARRMCKAHHEPLDCKDCPAGERKYICRLGYTSLEADSLEQMIETVEKWSKEHPRKTRLMDFLEKYPDAPLGENGLPLVKPVFLGYCGDAQGLCCRCKDVENSLAECWEMEVEEDG